MRTARFAVAATALSMLGANGLADAAQPLVQSLPPSTVAVELPPAPLEDRGAVPPLGAELADGLPQIATGEWTWQLLPEGLMYRSYLAGPREARFGSVWLRERDRESLWDITLGGRAGLIRFGTQDASWPEGYQLDVEGAAFPRLILDGTRDLDSVDFRVGFPLTYRRGPWEAKFGYYHLSSHLGDELMLRGGRVPRINYVRDSLILAVGLRPNRDLRLYAETGWAFYADGGAEPWEFLFGVEYSPVAPSGARGSPFFAIGAHLREENDFGGNMVLQTGWQWRGPAGHLLRVGLHYLTGESNQYQFYHRHEEQLGIGTWFDF